LRQGNSMVRVASVGGAELDDYTRYTFPQNSHEVFRVLHADRGFRSQGRWWLKDPRTLSFKPQRVEVLPMHAEHVRLNAHPEALLVAGDATQRESLLQLAHAIHVQHQAGLNTASLRFRFWQRMLQPLTMMVLLSIAVPFAFGHARDHSMGFKMMLGLMLAFAYDMLRQFLGPLSLIYRVPVLYAVLLPPVLLLALLLFLFRVRQRV
jgi:lipopolysaccharide export system permease protein